MLKPRPLPSLHKNQLPVPVRSIGFSTERPTVNGFYRHHAVVRKKLRRKPSQAWMPSSQKSSHSDEYNHQQATSRAASTRSPMYIRGRATGTDDVKISLNDDSKSNHTPQGTPEVEDADERNSSALSYLATTDRGFEGDDDHEVSFSPVLACSKYNVIGEPRHRKKRPVRSVWTLPKIPGPRGFITEFDDPDDSLRTNTIDVRSIYGQKSRVQYVPPEPSREDTVFGSPRLQQEETVILPPLQISKRRGDLKLDANAMAEKRFVMQEQTKPKDLRRIFRDHVAFPTAYRPYFRYKHRRERFARSVFPPEEFWENNRNPVGCSRCIHQSTATLHFCDVLGKRFCRFCSEMADRSFSQAYERSRLLVASPHKSPTLQMLKEPSFIGVRKVVITMAAKESREKEGSGDDVKLQAQ